MIHTEMINIGVVVDNEFYNDARVLNECKFLANQGFKVFVLCFDFNSEIKTFELNNITVKRIRFKRNKKNRIYAFNNTLHAYDHFWKKEIIAFTKQFQIDKLHVHDLYMSRPAYLAQKVTGIKFVLDLHENFPAAVQAYKWMHQFPFKFLIRPDMWQKKEKKYLEYAENIVVLSESFREDLVQKYPILKPQQFIIYPNVPNVEELLQYPIDETLLNTNDAFVLFYFGIISERRGVFTMIEAAKRLIPTIPNIKVLLIGPVDKAESLRFFQTINQDQLSGRVIHYPWKDISDLPSYINASDICLSPIFKNDQHESGIANKVFQYMLFERPLIVSNCKPQQRLIEEENCGLVFESDNAESLSQQVIALYNNPERRIKMGINGKKAILNTYNLTNMGKNLVQPYKN